MSMLMEDIVVNAGMVFLFYPLAFYITKRGLAKQGIDGSIRYIPAFIGFIISSIIVGFTMIFIRLAIDDEGLVSVIWMLFAFFVSFLVISMIRKISKSR